MTSNVSKTREMAFNADNNHPGPEVYSQLAAQGKRNILKRGPQRQTTVDLRRQGGERGSFLLSKHKSEYTQNYHHVI